MVSLHSMLPTNHATASHQFRPTGMASSRRRTRTVYSDKAIAYLEKQFSLQPYPDYDSRRLFARELGVKEDRIQVRIWSIKTYIGFKLLAINFINLFCNNFSET